MKANELMIDDWMLLHDVPFQVTSIYAKNGAREIGFGNKEDFWVDISNVEPIKITPEILEKNGWEKRPTGYVFYTDGKRYDNSLWYIFGSSNTFVVDTAEFQINYVHELQHILKILNIDKEIII